MKKKTEIITFKADEALLEAMKGIENRSKFIREAVFAALDNACPLCKGTGALSVNQKRHWDIFAEEHLLRECRECHEVHLVCASKPKHASHKKRSSPHKRN
jgi:uncharacterized protein YbaR (Trm112 family)